MNKLPTAEEFFMDSGLSGIEEVYANRRGISNLLMMFAKLHCKRQAEVIAESARLRGVRQLNGSDKTKDYPDIFSDSVLEFAGSCFGDRDTSWVVDKDSILNAYPESEIK